ncbi:MAG: GTP 3',8-cyclase MoaA [Myxococcales bacterium]
MDALRLNLPVVPAPGAVPMDAEAAAALGLHVVGPARADGLLDVFGRAHSYLRISVTERCNLRCRYCMPEEGVQLLPRDHLLSFEEIERLASLFVRLGVRKIRLTGGEPLVRKDIGHLVARIGALKRPVDPAAPRLEKLMLTSNALLLQQHIPGFLAAGMDAVNLSLDTLRPDRFRAITGRDGCEETIAAIHAAAAAGFGKVKVNAVVMKGVNDDELVDLARAFAREQDVDVRYIEYMPFEGNGWGSEMELFPAAGIRAALEKDLVLTPLGLDDGGTGTAQLYEARERSGARFKGRIGIISSMTEPFCGTCSRIRVTADGSFRWCLLDEGEVDLRGPLRRGATDADVAGLIETGLGRKRAGHAAAPDLVVSQRAAGPAHARSMIRIGG